MIAVLFFFFPHRRPLASSRVPEVPKNACPSSVDVRLWWSKTVQPDPTFTFSSQVVLRETTSQVSTCNPLIQIITPLSLLNTCIHGATSIRLFHAHWSMYAVHVHTRELQDAGNIQEL